MPTLGLVHTVHRVIPELAALAHELLPNVRQLHYLDESLLQDAIALQGLSADIIRRARTLIALAAQRSDVVLVTCSSLGPAADIAAGECYVPVLRLDRPMAEEAVRRGAHIAVLATLPSTLRPSAELVRQCAEKAGRAVCVTTRLVEGAFAAAQRGDGETHNRLVQEALAELFSISPAADIVLLAQASMAPLVAQLPAEWQGRVLSSPRSGLLRAAEILRKVAPS